jgi:hypothetical protein
MMNERGSSARQWKDSEEFATPNIILNAQKQDYVININNVEDVNDFNPFHVNQKKDQSKKNGTKNKI